MCENGFWIPHFLTGKHLKKVEAASIDESGARGGQKNREVGNGEKILHGDTAYLRYGTAVHWETGRGARALTDMASKETIRRTAHLRNLVIAEGMCLSIRTIGVILDFPRRGTPIVFCGKSAYDCSRSYKGGY